MSDSKPKSARKKIAGWTACGIWGLSIILSFAIPTSSPFIWIPDTVLLLGFFPLIWICPWSLVWILFGVLTTFIGSFLLLLINIPDSAMPPETHSIKKHLEEFHPWWSWMLLGLFVTVCGVIRLIVNVVKHFLRKKESSANP